MMTPHTSTPQEELDIDFSAPGQSPAAVKEAEILRVPKVIFIEQHFMPIAGEQRLQPIQQKFESDDPRIG